MSDCERFTQIAQDKWVTVSGCEQFPQVAHQKWANERITRFFEQITHSLILLQKNKWFAQKTDERIPNPAIIALLKTIKDGKKWSDKIQMSQKIWETGSKTAKTNASVGPSLVLLTHRFF